jgi:hypothetical protein
VVENKFGLLLPKATASAPLTAHKRKLFFQLAAHFYALVPSNPYYCVRTKRPTKISLHILLFYLVCSAHQMQADIPAGASATFLFNARKSVESKSGKEAQLFNASFDRDRFGNTENAVYLFGNSSSYIDLGTDTALKPRVGTISLWVRIEKGVSSGQGYHANPILLTKWTKDDDFFESFGFYYEYETQKMAACMVQDSLRQINITTLEKFDLLNWHHIVLSYDDDSLSLYIDGVLERRSLKGFPTRFLADEPVLVGVSANKKNNRFSQMVVDDIYFYPRVLTASEVDALYNAPDPNRTRIIFRYALYVLGFLVLVILIYLLLRYRLKQTLIKEKQQLEFQMTLLETELRVNRALMNPHFVFNSMNAVQGFILKNENKAANNYLIKFSKLMRLILESNTANSISLTTEIDLLKRYLEIEDLRFDENVKYTIHLQDGLLPASIQIPVMMIQPFVENAIWHGLLNKKGEKILDIRFNIIDSIYLQCIIEDNGTGRSIDLIPQPEKKSLAIQFIRQRLSLLNKLYKLNCHLVITDKVDHQGTIIEITLPIINHLS